MLQRSLHLWVVVVGIGAASVAHSQDKPPAGRWRGDLADPATKDVLMRVAMQTPDKPSAGARLSLLLLFHGYRGNENNYIGRTVDSLKRLGLLDQYVVISGKSKKDGWTADDDAPALKIIDWALRTYPIDPRRVFIVGSSNGAAFVGRFGFAHQDRFAGVVGYCGNYKFPADVKTDEAAEGRAEWYFVHGGKDNPQNSRRACDELRSKGYRCLFRQMDGYGHTDIWDSGGHPDTKAADAVREDWLLWTHALRHKRIAPTDADTTALAALSAEVGSGTPQSALPKLAEAGRIGGPAAARALIAAFASPHDEVREAAARAAAGMLAGDLSAALVKLLGDSSAPARAAAIDALAAAANWRFAEAQAALAAFARDPAKPSAERVRAAAGLGRAIRLCLLGNFEDARPIWALVLLLDDEDPAVREAAFAALSPASADLFGYKPDSGGADRQTAVEKWKTWCAAKCGPQPK